MENNKQNRQMFRNNTLLFVFLLGWNFLPAQSRTINTLSDGLGNFQKHYVYPSILRALIGEKDNSFNELVKDIEYVRILNLDSASIKENSLLFSSLNEALENENFDPVASMQEDGSKSDFFIQEQNERINDFILCKKEANTYLIIEIVGEVHIGKLRDLMNIDFSKFSILLE